MRTETRTLRPFFKLQQSALDDWSQGIGIRFSDAEDFTLEGSVQCNEEVSHSKPALCLPEGSPLLNPLPAEHVDLCVCFRDNLQEKSRIVLRMGLDGALGQQELGLDVGNKGLRWTPGKGAKIQVMLALNTPSASSVGLPHRKGHILCGREFHVNCASPGADYPVHFWSDADGVKRGLPSGWSFHIPDASDSLGQPTADSSLPTVYVNDRLQPALARQNRDKEAKRVADWLLASILAEIFRHCDDVVEDEGTLGQNLADRVAKALRQDVLHVSKLMKRDPHALAAAIKKIVPPSSKR